MTTLEILETKIRQSIPELKEEWEVMEYAPIDSGMITQIGLNHVLEYCRTLRCKLITIDCAGLQPYIAIIDRKDFYCGYANINLKSAYLKGQSNELITFLNELK